jgi:hypothetical protein
MSIFHDLIRPRYILLNDIFAIAELIEVITEEVVDPVISNVAISPVFKSSV